VSGVFWIDHLRPFQRSTNAVLTSDPTASHDPTAVQAFAEAHDTPSSSTVRAPAGLRTRRIDHLLPFQPSTSIPSVPWASLVKSPTATQARFDVHDTSRSQLLTAPAGFRVR
jgi:hypothetical protein